MTTVPAEVEATLRGAYDAFNRKDVDAVLATMHRDVDWPDMIEGVRVIGHDAVRLYWTRQFQTIDPHVEPRRLTEGPGGEVEVEVHQVLRDAASGSVYFDGTVRHVYTMRDGFIASMHVIPGHRAPEPAGGDG